MFASGEGSRILLLGRAPDALLSRMLEATWPNLQVEGVAMPSEDWIRAVLEPSVAGLVAETDPLDGSDLQVLLSLLRQRPDLRALLLVGSRGLVGFEQVMASAQVELIPQPWTPAALALLRVHAHREAQR